MIFLYLPTYLIQFKANRQPTAEHVNQLMTTNTFLVLQKLIVTAEMNILNTEWMGEQIQWFDYYIIANVLMWSYRECALCSLYGMPSCLVEITAIVSELC